MPQTYGSSATAVLMTLMLANREVSNTDLVNQYKIRINKAERDKLNADGLLQTTKDTRPYRHRITDKGIDWCMTALVEAELPPRSGPLARANFEVLRRLVKYLQARGTLAEAIRTGDMESLIREVYLELSTGRQDWVRLARVRPKLDGAGKREVDEALLKMMKAGTVHLVPDSNRKTLTKADHEAAVRIGGEDKHLMAIEES